MKNEKIVKTPLICKDGGSILGKWCRPCTQAHVPHRSQVRYHINIAGSKRKKNRTKIRKCFLTSLFTFRTHPPISNFQSRLERCYSIMIVPFSRYYDFYFIFCYINARRMALCLLSTKDKQCHIKIKDLFSQLRDNYHVKIGLLEVLFRQCTGGWSTNYSPDIN